MSAGRPPKHPDAGPHTAPEDEGLFDDVDADDADDQDAEEGAGGSRRGRSGIFGEAWRRAIASGANALFTSEDGGSRGPLGDMRLPKEAIAFLLSQTDRTRRDVGRVAGKELRRLLRNVDLGGELRRTLLGIRVRVRAEVTFEETGPRVQVQSKVVQRRGPAPRPAADRPVTQDAPKADAADDEL